MPLWTARKASRGSTLAYTLNWTLFAWAIWCGSYFLMSREEVDTGGWRYLALCLTGSAMVAVLGARRPGAAAWNFVILGLLAVLLLPVAANSIAGGQLRLEGFRAAFVGAVLAASPWFAYACFKLQKPASTEFDHVWLAFRNRFGLVWGQRLRDQFNRSAANSGWPVYLSWQGLRLAVGSGQPDVAQQEAMLANLQALMKRFRTENQNGRQDQ
jgi:hypothetical protein